MGPHMLEDKGSLVWEEEEEGILWKKTFWGEIFLPHLSQYFQYFFFVITSAKEVMCRFLSVCLFEC